MLVVMTDEADEEIHKVDTLRPAGPGVDAYSSPTVVGDASPELIDAIRKSRKPDKVPLPPALPRIEPPDLSSVSAQVAALPRIESPDVSSVSAQIAAAQRPVPELAEAKKPTGDPDAPSLEQLVRGYSEKAPKPSSMPEPPLGEMPSLVFEEEDQSEAPDPPAGRPGPQKTAAGPSFPVAPISAAASAAAAWPASAWPAPSPDGRSGIGGSPTAQIARPRTDSAKVRALVLIGCIVLAFALTLVLSR
jgi:hypothetical protein